MLLLVDVVVFAAAAAAAACRVAYLNLPLSLDHWSYRHLSFQAGTVEYRDRVLSGTIVEPAINPRATWEARVGKSMNACTRTAVGGAQAMRTDGINGLWITEMGLSAKQQQQNHQHRQQQQQQQRDCQQRDYQQQQRQQQQHILQHKHVTAPNSLVVCELPVDLLEQHRAVVGVLCVRPPSVVGKAEEHLLPVGEHLPHGRGRGGHKRTRVPLSACPARLSACRRVCPT